MEEENKIQEERERFNFRDKKFVAVMVFMGFVWLSLLVFFYLKTDEITRDPCSICAEKMGEDIFCTSQNGGIPVTRVYSANGSVTDNREEIKGLILEEFDKRKTSEVNFSGLNATLGGS
jgi:hypothetical protein